MKAPQKARSPYQRYEKTPHRYSPQLQAWQRAAKVNDRRGMDEADASWRLMLARRSVSGEYVPEPVLARRVLRQSFPPGIESYRIKPEAVTFLAA